MLRRAILSVLDTGNVDEVEILIANNDPKESWALRSVEREFPSVKVFSCGRNLGYGAAINSVSRFASGAVFAFLNPDTLLLSGDIALPLRLFAAYRNIGIIGAKLVSPAGFPEEWSAGKQVSLWQIIRNNFGFSTGKRIWRSQHMTLSGFVSGAAFFIRSDLFRRLGGFNGQFFLYFEDVDLCLRAGKSGFRTVFIPELVFCHDGGLSHESKVSQKKAYYRSQELYFQLHRPKWEYMTLKTMNKLWI